MGKGIKRLGPAARLPLVQISSLSFRSNPTSVEVSAAAEQQHYEEDDDQSVCVHFVSCVFG